VRTKIRDEHTVEHPIGEDVEAAASQFPGGGGTYSRRRPGNDHALSNSDDVVT
jgi:hypothetical protein